MRIQDIQLKAHLDVYIFVLVIILGIYSLIMSFIVIHRYSSYQSSWDLGVFTQSFEGLLKLGFMYDTLDFHKNPNGNYLGVHFSPVLIIITPLYYLFPTPITLLIIQILFYSIGAIPLYLVARKWLNKLSAILISLVYLIHPGTLYILIYDFHEVSLFPAIFIFTFYFYLCKRYLFFLLFLTFSCMINEIIPIVMCSFSLYLFLFHCEEGEKTRKEKTSILEKLRNIKRKILYRSRSQLFSLLALIVSMTMAFIAFNVEHLINPIWKPQQGWGILGSSLEEILISILSRPDLIIKSLIKDAELKFINLIYLLGPYLFLPLLSGFFLITLMTWIGPVLLSSLPICTIYLHYHTINMALTTIASVIGVKRLSNAINSRRIIAAIFLTTLIFTSLIGPFGLIPAPHGCCSYNQFFGYRIDLSRKTRHKVYDVFIDLIPEDAVVLTQVRFYPQLSDKTPYVLLHIPPKDWNLYNLVPLKEKLTPEFILLDLSEGTFNKGAYYSLSNGTMKYITPLSSTESILDDSWGVLAEYDSIVLYRRNFKGSPVLYGGFKKIYNPSELKYNEEIVTFYEKENIIEFSGGKSLVFWYGPYDVYPPGIYNVTFLLRVKPGTYYYGIDEKRILTLDVAANNGKFIVASREVKFNELSQEWSAFSIQFKVPLNPLNLEFRGLYPHPSIPIQLQRITVERIMTVTR